MTGPERKSPSDAKALSFYSIIMISLSEIIGINIRSKGATLIFNLVDFWKIFYSGAASWRREREVGFNILG